MTTFPEMDGEVKHNSLVVMIMPQEVHQAWKTKPSFSKLMNNSTKRVLLDFNKMSLWCQKLRWPFNWTESQISMPMDIAIHGNIVESKTIINSVMLSNGLPMPHQATKDNHQPQTQVEVASEIEIIDKWKEFLQKEIINHNQTSIYIWYLRHLFP